MLTVLLVEKQPEKDIAPGRAVRIRIDRYIVVFSSFKVNETNSSYLLCKACTAVKSKYAKTH